MDMATIGGIILAAIAIVGGLILEGGNVGQITQPTAALIVVGGTFGAIMVNFPMKTFILGLKAFPQIFKPSIQDPGDIIEDLVGYATKARKEGIISLEADVKNIEDEFLKKGLMMAIDGGEPKEIKETLERELWYLDEHGAELGKVWEQVGGIAPTIGIIGAVMGLIQVMGQLDDIEAVGHGIAVAFVATIYGLVMANIFGIPVGGKLAGLHKKNMVIKEMIIEGINLVIEGVNPMVMRDKLSGFFVDKVVKGDDEG